MKKIALVHLGVYGDLLYATTIAQQIKNDNVSCHITWYVGDKYKSILAGNPYVDEIIPMEFVQSRTDVKKYWFDIATIVSAMKEYDEIYYTQIYPGFPDDFKDSIRASMFRKYGKITVPLDPVVRLTQGEIDNAAWFAQGHNLSDYKNVILFECSPQSDQSSITLLEANEIAKKLADLPNTCVVMSQPIPCHYGHGNIFDASCLSFRENAELTKYCTLLIGMGSGITQICQSTAAKPLPTVQLLAKHSVASMKADHASLGLHEMDIIETTSTDADTIVKCVTLAMDSFGIAKAKYDEDIEPDFNIIRFHMRFDIAMMNRRYLDIIPALMTTIQDYGLSVGLLYFLSTFPKSITRILTRHSEGVY